MPFLSRSPVRDQATINALSAVVPNPFASLLPGTSLNGSGVTAATLLQAFPQFSGVRKRFSKGLQATVNYQHSRQLNSYQLNAGDPRLSYGVTSGDYPDHFVITGSYELPFGRGKRFLTRLIGLWM
jgi:hypothetical protein